MNIALRANVRTLADRILDSGFGYECEYAATDGSGTTGTGEDDDDVSARLTAPLDTRLEKCSMSLMANCCSGSNFTR
jgi:hypothetical protein